MTDALQQQAVQQIWRRQVASKIGGAGSTLNVSATVGFLIVPNCSGVPTGTPDGGNGSMVIDVTNNRLYFYSNGVWRNAGP